MLDEVLTTKDVTARLRLVERAVRGREASAESRVFKIRGQQRIERTELDPRADAEPRGGYGGNRGE